MTTLENAAAVLKIFSRRGLVQGRQGVSFTEVASELGLPRSTASRLLSTMERQGLLQRDPLTRAYHPGELLMSVASSYLAAPLVDSASPLMARLAAESGYNGYISVLTGREVTVMRLFQGQTFLQVVTPPGSRLPAAETAVGRALLACYSDDYIRDLYAGEWRVGSAHSPQTLQQMLTEVATIRHQGWSLAQSESLPGICALATTVSNKYRGETVALSLAFPLENQTLSVEVPPLSMLVDVTRQLAIQYGDRVCPGETVSPVS